MAAFSNYMEDQITGWINGSAFASTLSGGTFVQLYTQDPTDAGSHTGAVYTRAQVAASGWTRGTGGAGTLTNTGVITITPSAPSGATISHFAVFDVVTAGAGNMLFSGPLGSVGSPVTKVVASGDEVKFNATQLTLTVA
jgi:hypothetical protein